MFSKTFSRLKIFENAGFSFTCGRTKTDVFGYDDFIYHLLLALRFHCLTFSMDGWKRFEYATCESVYFLKKEQKDLRFQKYPDTCGRGLCAERPLWSVSSWLFKSIGTPTRGKSETGRNLGRVNFRKDFWDCYQGQGKKIGDLHSGVILVLRLEYFSLFLSYLNLEIAARFKNKSLNLHKKAKRQRILVVVVKWRHRANGLWANSWPALHQ